MSIGNQASTVSVNNSLSNITTNLRNMMQIIENLNTFINGQDTGEATLANIGFSTTASSTNPGGLSDAAYALEIISYLSVISGVYYGTVQSQGSGGTGAVLFDFDNAFAPMWGGN